MDDIDRFIDNLKGRLRLAHQENLRLKRQQREATIRANDLREENERLRNLTKQRMEATK